MQRRFIRTCESDINYEIMQKMLKENSKITVLDVRTKDEYKQKHLEGAINIPMHEIEGKIQRFVGNKNDVIIVYCEYGGRSKKVVNKLKKIGYANVYNLEGGMEGI